MKTNHVQTFARYGTHDFQIKLKGLKCDLSPSSIKHVKKELREKTEGTHTQDLESGMHCLSMKDCKTGCKEFKSSTSLSFKFLPKPKSQLRPMTSYSEQIWFQDADCLTDTLNGQGKEDCSPYHARFQKSTSHPPPTTYLVF